MGLFLRFLASLLVLAYSTGAISANVSEKKYKDTHVLLISIDGFRADYLSKYSPPELTRLAEMGTVSRGLIPGFPSLTFPNHVSIVTGRYPGNHGIVSNFFYDKKLKRTYGMNDGDAVRDSTWYKGEPIWTLAEKSGIKSAVFFWVGSEAKIGGVDPTYLVPYDGSIPNHARGEQVKEWLRMPNKERPRFISLYFSDVDSAGHRYGPDSKEVRESILEIDQIIGSIVKESERLNISLQTFIVSDHGMRELDVKKTIDLSDKIDLRKVMMVERGGLTNLYIDNKSEIPQVYSRLKNNAQNYKVYLRKDIPRALNYQDPDRVGDILVLADPGYYIYADHNFALKSAPRLNKATHGWDPADTQMHGLFIAYGDQILSKNRIPAFENVHIYPLILKLLDLKNTEPIDGQFGKVKVLQ